MYPARTKKYGQNCRKLPNTHPVLLLFASLDCVSSPADCCKNLHRTNRCTTGIHSPPCLKDHTRSLDRILHSPCRFACWDTQRSRICCHPIGCPRDNHTLSDREPPS